MHESRDPAEYDEASYEVDFADFCDGQPESTVSSYREASEKMMRTLNTFISFLAEHGHSRSKTLWGIAYALGHPMTAGMSMLEAARALGCTKQAISKIACNFLADTGLPPSSALKSEEAKQTYKITNGNRKQQTNA